MLQTMHLQQLLVPAMCLQLLLLVLVLLRQLVL